MRMTHVGAASPRALVAALIALVALAVSACGETSPAARIAEAAEATTADDTARFTLESELSGLQGTAEAIRIVGDGASDFPARRTRMTMRMEGAPEGFEMEMLADGSTGVTYTRNSLMPVPEGSWLRIDPADLGVSPESLDLTAEGSDPTTMLQHLERLATEIEEVGEDTVRGEPATRYRMTLDYAKALDDVEDERTRETLGLHMAAMGLAVTDAEVWVDERGRVVRLTQHVDHSKGDPDAVRDLLGEHLDDAVLGDGGVAEPPPMQGSQTVTMELYDFGADVDLDLPSDDDVVDFDDLGL